MFKDCMKKTILHCNICRSCKVFFEVRIEAIVRGTESGIVW